MNIKDQKSAMATIKRSLSYFTCALQRRGIEVDADELESDLGEAYAQAIRKYNDGNSNKKASFSTYLFACMKFACEDYYKRAERRARMECALQIGESDIIDDDSVLNTIEAQVECKELMEQIIRKVPPRGRLIAKEIICTSPEVSRELMQIMSANERKLQQAPEYAQKLILSKTTKRGAFVKACANVHGMSVRLAQHYMQLFFSTAKKHLTSAV
jgi:DNA-directed RNA polymerase specialized sigma24 family protein